MNKTISPSRTYVAMCNRSDFAGYYFKRFSLPDMTRYFGEDINNSDKASWYFLNHLDYSACIEGCITGEDFLNYIDIDDGEPAITGDRLQPAIDPIMIDMDPDRKWKDVMPVA